MNTLPSLIENEINSHLSLIYTRISAFKKRGADLISGELKNEMCWWWLDHIGTRVDRYFFFFFLIIKSNTFYYFSLSYLSSQVFV